ncbi:hypothetical protein ACTG9Q_24620 [Actinokineospora sp. 24-640]
MLRPGCGRTRVAEHLAAAELVHLAEGLADVVADAAARAGPRGWWRPQRPRAGRSGRGGRGGWSTTSGEAIGRVRPRS